MKTNKRISVGLLLTLMAASCFANTISIENNIAPGYIMVADNNPNDVVAYGQKDTQTTPYFGYGVKTGDTYYTHVQINNGVCVAGSGKCLLTKSGDNAFKLSLNPIPPKPASDTDLKNNTPYYLFAKQSGCFVSATDNTLLSNDMAKPGEKFRLSQATCGMVACATTQYSASNGCQEFVNPDASHQKGDLTQGGYASYATINNNGASCSVPGQGDYNKWNCSITKDATDADTNDLNLVYKDVTQTDSAGNVVKLATPQTYSNGVSMRGVNISGMEYDGSYLDALFQLPDLPEMVDFTNDGMNTVRLPVRAEFLYGKSGDVINSTEADPNAAGVSPNYTYIRAIHNIARKYLASGLHVVLDLHNYMRFCNAGEAVGQMNEPTNNGANGQPICSVLTAQQLANIWHLLMTTKAEGVNNPDSVTDESFAGLAQKYPQTLVFEIMNEPYSQTVEGHPEQVIPTATVLDNEIAAAKQIRAAGANNLILFSGNYWDPLHGWVHGNDDTKKMGIQGNGEVYTADKFQGLGDVGVDVHQYFNKDYQYPYSGTSPDCHQWTADTFAQDLDLNDFQQWMQANHMKVFLGEFGASTQGACVADMQLMLNYVNAHAYTAEKGYGFIGWTGWRANRHGDATVGFNFLQQANPQFYTKLNDPIKAGAAAPLMQSVFINGRYLKPLNS